MNTIYPNQVLGGTLVNIPIGNTIIDNLQDYDAVTIVTTEEEKALQKTNGELKMKVAALEEELKGLKKILDD